MNSSVDYAYAFKSKSVEPFKKAEFMKKSDYWKLLSDFNFNYLPTNMFFNTNIKRQYNRQQFRQVEVEGIGLDPLYRRNFAFNCFIVPLNLTEWFLLINIFLLK